ncbi:uncharacterized protein LOC110381734 isoform X1 [Helicoverpa armigera]|uniref:uncharacterized protein LOC110381734 isoform X1 n=1 Tax=Helicoverpa armigera TaxID=29058 RepID=UPI003083EA28
MSFLSILLVASAFYFAHARPDAGSPEWNSKPADSHEPASHDASYDDSSYQESGHQESPSDRAAYERLSALMTDFGKAMDTHLTPLMTKMAEHKQKEMKSIGLDGMASYLNYMYLMIQEYEHDKEKEVNSTSHDPSKARNNEIILQFDSPYHVDWPFIHDTHDEHKVAN